MATSAVAAERPMWRERARIGAARSTAMLAGAAIVAVALGLMVALASYHGSDAGLNTAAGSTGGNWLGAPGAWAADLLLTLAGPAIALALPLVLLTGLRIARGVGAGRWQRGTILMVVALLLGGTAATAVSGDAVLSLPATWGGAFGIAGSHALAAGTGMIPDAMVARGITLTAAALCALGALVLAWFAWDMHPSERAWLGRRARADADADERIEVVTIERERPTKTSRAARPVIALPDANAPGERPTIADPKPAETRPRSLNAKTRQGSLELGDDYQLPGMELLAPKPPSSGPAIDKAALERNAQLLMSVLEDFHVKGRIVEVRPGPVVTMYELDPAPGIKASRVIQLADDIARNMSALSARVATIPGRTVIGIELPNARREAVAIRELMESDSFEARDIAQLPLVLGKNIAGDPVVADLAPMPHLLIAGTTGSGKSVGLNTMILSLLYRLNPDQCRMIMIDPKMLELSVYDDIPHLLAPVVTDPPKAIRALKWAVEQMEERYRMMASLGVRGLASYNERVRSAKAKGQTLNRKVQTGYQDGQPIIEEEELDYEVLPQIVVVVDELADLMMTAGKEVEFLIQRLAQKARAAGIHLIMATQRPSVDVITGVIKANLPTRISFAVTSKIDSRTILGEQGAEQLLGKGDMLYMHSGKQLVRVHGPFVSDDEVRAVADHWRAQKQPDYVTAVTEEPADGGFALEGAPKGDDSPDDQLYRKAVQVVADSQKASTSYVQRQLRIGYNSAARLIERMEKEGVVGRPDHVGRREVLVDTDGRPV